ncbi:MAG: Secretion system C-terminal sorting domain, partial [Bacteroidetes bacterium]|nr:Secretion system C-terminal sorting domain [Bacteroidota bacterium]
VGSNTVNCMNTKTISVSVVSCVGINETSGVNYGIEIYPNPNHGSLNVSFENLSPGTSIRIYNIMGALIKDVKATSAKTLIDLQNEANGVYMLKVMQGDKLIRSAKIVKQ